MTFPFKLRIGDVSWGGPSRDWYMVWWFNWLPRKRRYWGYFATWYDGPHESFGLWFFNVGWSNVPWCTYDGS